MRSSRLAWTGTAPIAAGGGAALELTATTPGLYEWREADEPVGLSAPVDDEGLQFKYLLKL
jgi:hypothetical protein